jgi:hypothetical protein
MENKKIIIGVGAVALLVVVYYMMTKKKVVGTTMEEIVTAIVPIAPYTIQWKADPTGAVFVVIDGKKYGFSSGKAFDAYGRSEPKSVTKEEVDAIPTGGWVNELGKVIQN